MSLKKFIYFFIGGARGTKKCTSEVHLRYNFLYLLFSNYIYMAFFIIKKFFSEVHLEDVQLDFFLLFLYLIIKLIFLGQ